MLQSTTKMSCSKNFIMVSWHIYVVELLHGGLGRNWRFGLQMVQNLFSNAPKGFLVKYIEHEESLGQKTDRLGGETPLKLDFGQIR